MSKPLKRRSSSSEHKIHGGGKVPEEGRGDQPDNQEHQTRAATSYLDDVQVVKKYRILPANTKHCTLNVCLTNVTFRLIPASFYTFFKLPLSY